MTAVAPSKTTFFDAIYETLPSVLKDRVDNVFAERGGETRHTFDRLLRFSLGGIHPEGDAVSQAEWDAAQNKLELVLSNLKADDSKGGKRGRDDDKDDGSSQQAPKRTKLDSDSTLQDSNVDGSPIYTLHAISVAAPVRKKVDITIRERSICFTNPASGAVESVVPIEALTRAYLLPTPGKTKAHWTVVLLANTEQNQIIFGTDDVLPSLKTTTHPDPPQTSPKGTSVEASLRKFLSHLPSRIPLLEPSVSQFRSDNRDPWLTTYLRAKEGHLFFFQSGVLFGIKKPCMWIGMEEIKSVRTLSATGRTFSIFVTRQPKNGEQDSEGEETEFSMADGKDQDSVLQWIQNNKHLFGVVQDGQQKPVEKMQKQNSQADLDESDDSDYHSESESDGGSPSSSSSEEGEESEEEQESGSVEDDDEVEEGDEDEEAPLDPSRHPLMAPGAVPRLSKAAMDAVIGMVERDLKRGTDSIPNGHEIDELGDDDDYVEEIDQLN